MLLLTGFAEEESNNNDSCYSEFETDDDSEASEDPDVVKEQLAVESTYEIINSEVPELAGVWEPPLERKRSEEGTVLSHLYN